MKRLILVLSVCFIFLLFSGCTQKHDFPEKTEFMLEETAKTSDREVTVKSIERSDKLRFCVSSGTETACDYLPSKDGEEFLSAIVEVKNTSPNDVFFSATRFGLTDSDGTDYPLIVVNMREDRLPIIYNLLSNEKISGSILFMVPKEVTELKVNYDFNSSTEKLASWKVQ